MKFSKFLLAALVTAVSGWSAWAAESLENSPWVGWRRGFASYNQAGEFKADNQYQRALALYQESLKCFQAIRRNFPDWNASVIEGRIELCQDEIANLERLMGKSRPEAAPSDVPSATPVPPKEMPSGKPQPPNYSAPQPRNDFGSSGGGRLYIEMQSEIEQYKQRLRSALMEIDALQIKLQQSEVRTRDVDGMMQDYRKLQEKCSLLEMQLKNAQAKTQGTSPEQEKLQEQLVSLKRTNDDLERDRRRLEADITRKDADYAQSRRELLEAKDQLQKHQNEVKRLTRELENAKNSQDTGQIQETAALQEKIRNLEAALQKKNQELESWLSKVTGTADAATVNAAAVTEIRTLKEQIAALEAAPSHEVALQKRIADLTADIATLQKQLQDSETRFRQSDREYQALMESTRQQTSARDVQSQELKTLRDHTAQLEAEVRDWSTRYQELAQKHRDRLDADAISAAQGSAAPDQSKALQIAQDRLQVMSEKLAAADELVKASREAVIESKGKMVSQEIELKKMADLKTAYDELQGKYDLLQQNGNPEVVASLNRIPGLEESLRRYAEENKNLLLELNKLKANGGQTAGGQAIVLPMLSPEKIDTLLADARNAEARGSEEVAIWDYRQILSGNPHHTEAARNLGGLLLERGNYSEATQFLEMAHQIDAKDLKCTTLLMRSLIGSKDYARALQLAETWKKSFPDQTDINFLIAEALAWSRSGKAPEAEKAFQAVLKLDPHHVEAAHELALMLSADEKRKKEACNYYMQAKENGCEVDPYLEEILQSDSDQGTTGFLKQSALDALNTGDFTSAEWYLTEALKSAPEDEALLVLKSMQLLFAGKTDEALKALPEALQTPDAQLLRAVIFQEKQNAAEVQKFLTLLKDKKAGANLKPLQNWLEKYSKNPEFLKYF